MSKGGWRMTIRFTSRRPARSQPPSALHPFDFLPVYLLTFLLVCLVWNFAQAAPSSGWQNKEAISQGDNFFNIGQFENAVQTWTDALRDKQIKDNAKVRIDIWVRRAEAYQALGRHQKAIADLSEAFKAATGVKDDELLARIRGSLGNAYFFTGDLVRAEVELTESLKFAQSQKKFTLIARTQNNLGNVRYALGRLDEAATGFRASHENAMRAGDQEIAATALLNAARVTFDLGGLGEVQSLAKDAGAGFAKLEDSHFKAMGLIAAGQMLNRLSRIDNKPSSDRLSLAFSNLELAKRVAESIGDDRAGSYAHGALGGMYEDQHRLKEALQLTRQALFRAQRINAPEILYLWQRQAGRIHRTMGNIGSALESYRRAVGNLRSIRSELLVRYSGDRSIFPDSVKPVFLEFVDLLFLASDGHKGNDKLIQADLGEARQTMELLKTAELEDYYQDDCIQSLQAKVKPIDQLSPGTAALYPIILPDRTELLVTLANGMVRKTVPVNSRTMTAEIRYFRDKLGTPSTREYLIPARNLYDWLIRPFEQDFAKMKIDTLVIIPSGPLRTVPFAPLHDGSQFLIEKLAISVVPGLTLLDPRPFQDRKADPLLSGLTQSVQGFPSLPYVDEELTSIHNMFGGKVFKDETFLTANLESELGARAYSIVHIASHAQFTDDASKSYLLTYDGKLSMNELEKFMKLSWFRDEPIELLTLSACNTASGDDRAALGLAGIAIKSGARSALASLWSINDQSTSLLITKFYEELKANTGSKAQALREAQLHMLKNRQFRHPFYWSAFLLIGNWL